VPAPAERALKEYTSPVYIFSRDIGRARTSPVEVIYAVFDRVHWHLLSALARHHQRLRQWCDGDWV